MSVWQALASFPQGLREGLEAAYDEGGKMAQDMLGRPEMPQDRALLAGLALDPRARVMVERALDDYAQPEEPLPATAGEVIIGGGAHAAIYAAVRVKMGFPKPLVLERNRRFGGTFAMTRQSSFYLNSRNRPGPLGAAGSRDALNVIPGAMMQPSDMGGAEYQANADLGLVVRCTLALNAVVRQAKVTEVGFNGGRPVVITDRGVVRAQRIIVATGIGAPKQFNSVPFDGKRVLSFGQFMRRFDEMPFPLRDLGRVAVIGGGDSGRTVIEALTGYGPYMGGSVASLDYVERIDWYGIEENMTKERWLECNRTRYKQLAALFPSRNGDIRNARVRGLPRVKNLYNTYDAIRIEGEAYETTVACLGYLEGDWRNRVGFDSGQDMKDLGSTPDGTRGPIQGLVNATGDRETVCVVGPAADLAFGQGDPEPRIEENRVALFRLAPRTAALAVRLGPTSTI